MSITQNDRSETAQATPQIFRVELPSTMIAEGDLEGLEAIRRHVYGQATLDAADRTRELTEIAGLVELRNGNGLSILDVLTAARDQKLTHTIPDKVEKGIGYKFALNEAGEVVEINKVSHLPQDKRATKRAQAMSKRIPSGPKKNGSSFKVTIANPRPHPRERQ